MPNPDSLKNFRKSYPGPPLGQIPKIPSRTEELLEQLIREVRGLRTDIKAANLLPNTELTRRIFSEINTTGDPHAL